MFNLKKLSFITKITTVSVIVILISMGIVYLMNTHSITVVKINDWVFITSNDEGNYFYKANLVYIDNQTHVIKAWVKIVYTDKGKRDFIKTHKEGKYNDIDLSLINIVINYQKNTFQENRVVNYSKSGNVINSDEFSATWDDIIPKSVCTKILNKLFEDYNIKT